MAQFYQSLAHHFGWDATSRQLNRELASHSGPQEVSKKVQIRWLVVIGHWRSCVLSVLSFAEVEGPFHRGFSFRIRAWPLSSHNINVASICHSFQLPQNCFVGTLAFHRKNAFWASSNWWRVAWLVSGCLNCRALWGNGMTRAVFSSEAGTPGTGSYNGESEVSKTIPGELRTGRVGRASQGHAGPVVVSARWRTGICITDPQPSNLQMDQCSFASWSLLIIIDLQYWQYYTILTYLLPLLTSPLTDIQLTYKT
jgi:hypothetical protein